MTKYNPENFAQIMRTIYNDQVRRYELSGIDPHPRAYQEQVQLRAKIQALYALDNHNYPIWQIAEAVLLALRDGKFMKDILALNQDDFLKFILSILLIHP